MSFVIAIDVGIKNLGICVFDFTLAKIVEWDNVTLVPNGRYIPANNVQYVLEFVKKYATYFDNAFQIVVERQMRCNMKIVEAVIQTMFFERCVLISARSVKMHYGLSTKNYRANKQKAVQWAKQFVSRNYTAFGNGELITRFKCVSKQDDMADSLLLVMYYLDTYSNQLTSDLDFFYGVV